MKQSENMVLEAMAHLSAVHDALEEMLTGSLHGGGADGHQPSTSTPFASPAIPSAYSSPQQPSPARHASDLR